MSFIVAPTQILTRNYYYVFSRSSCQTFFSCFKLRCTHMVVIKALPAAQANGNVQPICSLCQHNARNMTKDQDKRTT